METTAVGAALFHALVIRPTSTSRPAAQQNIQNGRGMSSPLLLAVRSRLRTRLDVNDNEPRKNMKKMRATLAMRPAMRHPTEEHGEETVSRRQEGALDG